VGAREAGRLARGGTMTAVVLSPVPGADADEDLYFL
jgi:hypothetical protein